MPTQRDFEYIEARLLAPAEGASDALSRLRAVGYIEEADALADALKVFTDRTRSVRRDVEQRFRAQDTTDRRWRP